MQRVVRAGIVLAALLGSGVGSASAEAQIRIGEWGMVAATTVSTGGPISDVRTTSLRSLEVSASILGPSTTWLRLDFPLGVVLAARLANTALGPATGFGLGPTREWRVGDAVRTTARAFGVRPLGVRLAAGPDAFQLLAETAVGALLFNIPAPASNASRFNYTVDAGVGVRVRIPHGRVTSGYRLHHLSNGGRGRVNPGVDSHMLYFGIAFY